MNLLKYIFLCAPLEVSLDICLNFQRAGKFKQLLKGEPPHKFPPWKQWLLVTGF